MSKKSGKTVLKIALTGSDGRMGKEIQAHASPGAGVQIAAKVEQADQWAKIKPAAIDVVVDFSTPAGLVDALDWACENNKPLVSGTTGLSSADSAKLKKAASKIPIMYSANMSMGIAALEAMLQSLRGISDWDFQIEEAHHKLKKDRPSGTAVLLQEKLQNIIGRKLPLPNAIRGGGIPGIHRIWAMGPDESIVLQHTAFNRKVFAQGALNAARWLFDNKAPGLYDLSDLYKLT